MFESKPPKILYALIILSYIIGVTFAPNLMALDTNASKFLTLAGLNLVCFGLLVAEKESRGGYVLSAGFLPTTPGLFYSCFLAVSLLSLTQSVNQLESILSLAKMFSVFSAVFLLSMILMRDKRHIKLIVFSMAALLLLDAVSVFYKITLFIHGTVGDIADIKTIYSNKNILASSLYVKLPFALWLMVFGKRWSSRIGAFVMGSGMLAIFIMSTRAFYLGIFIFFTAFLVYSTIDYYQRRDPGMLKAAASLTGALVLAFSIYSAIQYGLYPASESRYTDDVATRFVSIQDDIVDSPRMEAWQWTIDLIRENPLLGVGIGNWKIAVLKHENQESDDFQYHYKAHNDFLENTAETGIIGGLLFLSVFAAVGWDFLRYRYKQEYSALFLAAAGLACYAIDAAFNFPADRPEILLLFSLYLSIGIAASRQQNLLEQPAAARHSYADEMPGGSRNKDLKQSPSAITRRQTVAAGYIFSTTAFLLMLVASFIVLHMNFKSSRLQRMAYEDILSGQLSRTSDIFVDELPFIPNITHWGESIASVKARYLLKEDKNGEAISLLKKERSNPWDARREILIATAYHNKGMSDKALHYSQKAHTLKPYYFPNIHLLVTLLAQQDRKEEIPLYLTRYLKKEKKNAEAWVYTAMVYRQLEMPKQALKVLEAAKHYLPDNDRIDQHYQQAYNENHIAYYEGDFDMAVALYNQGNYTAALKALNQYIKNVPENPNAFRVRAFAQYYLRAYTSSISDINHYLNVAGKDPSLLNLRGACFEALDDANRACQDFGAAMSMGHEIGKTNYKRICN